MQSLLEIIGAATCKYLVYKTPVHPPKWRKHRIRNPHLLLALISIVYRQYPLEEDTFALDFAEFIYDARTHTDWCGGCLSCSSVGRPLAWLPRSPCSISLNPWGSSSQVCNRGTQAQKQGDLKFTVTLSSTVVWGQPEVNESQFQKTKKFKWNSKLTMENLSVGIVLQGCFLVHFFFRA